MFRVLFGMFLAVLFLGLALGVWLFRGKVPVAVSDPPLPFEAQVTGLALHARIDRELIQMPPIQPDEHVFIAGAHVYGEMCATCHGYHGKPSDIGQSMFPAAPPLWEKHQSGPAVGVSDDPPGETYWKVANGIRLTGMPEFRSQLTDTEMWEVSLLLANANKPLPPAAVNLLRGEPAPAPVSTPKPAKIPVTAPPQSTP